MSTKPPEVGRWATDVSANVVVPPSGKQDVGNQFAEFPDDGFFNWIFKTAYLWQVYLRDGYLSGAFGLTSVFTQSAPGPSVTQYDNLAVGDVTSLQQTYATTNAATITGIAGIGGAAPQPGRILQIFNDGAALGNTLTLSDQNASSTAANRFYLGGSSVVLTNHGSCVIWYDGTISRWRVVASHKLQ